MTGGNALRVMMHALQQNTRLLVTIAIATAVATAAACANVTTSPSEPVSLEFRPPPAPAVVLGDSLRDIDGKAAPIVAIVRNLQGNALTGQPLRYVYVDAQRDTAFAVDSITGFVKSLKPLGTTTFGTFTSVATTARFAARVGKTLLVLDTLFVTSRPDSVDRAGATTVDTLFPSKTDSTVGTENNTSAALSVTIRHVDDLGVWTTVNRWLVKYEVLQPANSTNNPMSGAYIVNELGNASAIDTTDGSGVATRFVRVRPSIFPPATGVDSVVVRVTVTYQGQNVKGSPIRIAVPVKKS